MAGGEDVVGPPLRRFAEVRAVGEGAVSLVPVVRVSTFPCTFGADRIYNRSAHRACIHRCGAGGRPLPGVAAFAHYRPRCSE